MLVKGEKNSIALVCIYVVGAILIPCLTVLFGKQIESLSDAEKFGQSQYTMACMRDLGWFEKPIWLENEVVSYMSRLVEQEAPEEFLKAFSIVLRSEILAKGTSDNSTNIDQNDDIDVAKWEKCERMAEETKGIYLTYNHQVIVPLWTRLTNGKTREGEENHIKGKPYFRKLICKEDVMSPLYATTVEWNKKDFLKMFAAELAGVNEKDNILGWPNMICQRDSSDYVMTVRLGEEGRGLDGVEFADRVGLASPCFTWKYLDDAVVFQVKGCGHGYGMSLNQAQKFAEEGKTFREILTYFYPQTELDKCY